ncbi:gem-associated protein 4-like [Lytechinus variegatus]|uniref:gem-associated protein 4-like n=1 Tax=Lytechinus variegatus TaxID=7654 RepID=UPI001BB115DE|nr:gem-associated protein 4-like [Lytechinus variegatus]
MDTMECSHILREVASLSKNANSWRMSRGEQVSHLHQTLLAISNILDYQEDKMHCLKARLEEKTSTCTSETLSAGNLESGYPSAILQLFTQRLALQAKVPSGPRPVSSESLLSRRNQFNHADDSSICEILLDILSSLDHCYHDQWKHSLEQRQTLEKQDTENDPFSGNLSFLGEQCLDLLVQQMNAVRDRCKRLAEEEVAVATAVRASRDANERLLAEDRKSDRGTMSFEECAWRIRERLAGYEESLNRILHDLWDWTDYQGIQVLEENQQLLITPRWVKKLLILALEFQGQRSKSISADVIDRHKRLLKLSSDCFAALPLPLQSTLFQWLWKQPNGPTIFKESAIVNVEQELTQVFNRLVTGSTDGQLSERAREICSVALHCPSSTLQKAIQEAVLNVEAGSLICKVLRRMRFLVDLQLDGKPCFLTELSKYVRTLGERQLSSSEEVNLFKFADNIMQSYNPPSTPANPVTCQPLVHPLHLANCCIWPFLGPGSQDQTHKPGPGPSSQFLAPGSDFQQKAIPKHITLKFLDLVLKNSLFPINEQGQGGIDISVCFSTMLSLCHILQDCTLSEGGDISSNLLIKEMTSDLLERLSAYVQEVHAENLSLCVEWLVDKASHLDWTVRLTLHGLFSDAVPSCHKEVFTCIEEITSSIHPSRPITEAVPLYTVWSCSLIAFFQGARLSSQLSEQFVKSLLGALLPMVSSSRADFYRAVCLGLAQVLPHSSSPEWLTLLETLDLMRKEGLLHVSYTSQFMTSLPLCDITVCQHPLQLSQIFTTVVQLLSGAGFSDWLSNDQWQHITKTYTKVMKKILSSATESISLSASSSAHSCQVFLIGQLFCQSCVVSPCVRESATEQLFVWTLELAMRVEELVSCHSDDDDSVSIRDESYQELKTLIRAIDWLPDGGQRSTLQQKVTAILSKC